MLWCSLFINDNLIVYQFDGQFAIIFELFSSDFKKSPVYLSFGGFFLSSIPCFIIFKKIKRRILKFWNGYFGFS